MLYKLWLRRSWDINHPSTRNSEWLNDVIAKLPYYLDKDSRKKVRELFPDVWKLEKSNANPIGV